MSNLVEKVARTLWLEQELGLPQRTRIPFEERKSDLVINQAKAAIATVLREMMEPSRKWHDPLLMLRAFAAEHNIALAHSGDGEGK